MGDARSRARCCRLPGTNCCFPVPRCTNRFLLQSLYFPWTRQWILAAVFPQDVPTPTSHRHGAGLGTLMVPQSAARAAPFQTWCITERAAGLVALNGFHPLCSASCSVLFACRILFASCMQDLSSMQCCWLQAAPGCTQGPHCMQCPGCTHDAGCSQGPRCMQLAGCIRGTACMLCAAAAAPSPCRPSQPLVPPCPAMSHVVFAVHFCRTQRSQPSLSSRPPAPQQRYGCGWRMQ